MLANIHFMMHLRKEGFELFVERSHGVMRKPTEWSFLFCLQFLGALLKVKNRGGDGQLFRVNEMHIHRHHASAVGVDANVVAEEGALLASKRLLFDLVIDKGLGAVGAAG